MRNVLLVGLKPILVEDVKNKLQLPNVRLFAGSSLEDVRATFAQTKLDAVIMGAGIELEKRLEIVREIFLTSETTTVHLKDVATGPEGFLPFVRSVLHGLDS